MSEKYAKEMLLVPKDQWQQRGGQSSETVSPMDTYWRRQRLIDELTNAPQLDRMIKLMDDMRAVEGQAQPPSMPSYGVDSSEYFRLQNQLQRLQPTTMTPRPRTQRFVPPPSKQGQSMVLLSTLQQSTPELVKNVGRDKLYEYEKALYELKREMEQNENDIARYKNNDDFTELGYALTKKKELLPMVTSLEKAIQGLREGLQNTPSLLETAKRYLYKSNEEVEREEAETIKEAIKLGEEGLKGRERVKKVKKEGRRHRHRLRLGQPPPTTSILGRKDQEGLGASGFYGALVTWRKPRGWVQE